MRTIFNVDGFNLYYKMLEYRPAERWLNHKLLSECVLSPQNIVTGVKYYTVLHEPASWA